MVLYLIIYFSHNFGPYSHKWWAAFHNINITCSVTKTFSATNCLGYDTITDVTLLLLLRNHSDAFRHRKCLIPLAPHCDYSWHGTTPSPQACSPQAIAARSRGTQRSWAESRRLLLARDASRTGLLLARDTGRRNRVVRYIGLYRGSDFGPRLRHFTSKQNWLFAPSRYVTTHYEQSCAFCIDLSHVQTTTYNSAPT